MSGRPDFSSAPRGTRPRRGSIVLAAGALALALLSAHSAWTARAEAARVQRLVDAARREAEAAAALADRGSPGEPLRSRLALTEAAPPARVLADIGALLPDDVRLEGLGLGYGPQLEVELRLAAREARAYDRFLERLQESKLVASVEPGDETRDSGVRSMVKLVYRPAASR
jgi:Tfp pilus assembly protein PilN